MSIGSAIRSASSAVSSAKKSLRAAQASQDVRRFLAEAMSFLNGLKTSSGYASYTLETALAQYSEELSGTPANGRLNRLQRLDTLLAKATTAVAIGSALEEEDLGLDVVSAGGFTSIGGMLSGLSPLKSALPDSLPDPGIADAFSSATVAVGTAKDLYSGGAMIAAKDYATGIAKDALS